MKQIHINFFELIKITQIALKKMLYDYWYVEYKFKNDDKKPSEAQKELQLEYINKLFNLNNAGIDIDMPSQNFYV